MAKVTGLKIAEQSNSRTLYASWAFSKKHLSNYTVAWYYSTGNGIWFSGSSSNVTTKYNTYSPPDNWTSVKVSVKPNSTKDKKKGKKKTTWWTGVAVTLVYSRTNIAPETPSAPELTIEGYGLTVILNTEDPQTDQVEFQILKNNATFKTATAKKANNRASYNCKVDAGGTYRARCRGINQIGGKKNYGAWSPYSGDSATSPSAATNLNVTVESSTSVLVTWSSSLTAESYTVEYTTNSRYFDTNSDVQSVEVSVNKAIITGLETGRTWYFRVKATNAQGDSGWLGPKSAILGKTPSPPTTWSSTTTAMIGDTVVLYWVHNTEDGSAMKTAEIEIYTNGRKTHTELINYEDQTEDNHQETVNSYNLELTGYSDGVKIEWRVRTSGIVGTSDWSVKRTINVYAPPTVSIDAEPEFTMFPYVVSITAGPSNQLVLGYYIAIYATEDYQQDTPTEDGVKWIKANDAIFARNIDSSTNPFKFTFYAYDVTFVDGQEYRLEVTVTFDSGLTETEEFYFTTSFSDDSYSPDASIEIDEDTLVAYINPFCEDEEENLIDNIRLSVYRREFNGSFTEIGTDLENDGNVTITDPHPALDYARYRIVATNQHTGVTGYEDLPGIPMDEPSIVVQWDEKWTRFNYNDEDDAEEPPWSGSMIKLPYNVDVNESTEQDVSLINYIGRESPVSYYGTQKGVKASLSTVIPKDDRETVYALRRLANYAGDVYVREPSGIGYWANVTVSFDIKHVELTIPITLEITRVDKGGML